MRVVGRNLGFSYGDEKMRKFSRRIKKKTDYRQRLTLLRSGKCRAVVRVSTNNVRIQFVKFTKTGDLTVVDISSKSIIKLGWKGHAASMPCAYLVGFYAGKQALQKNEKQAILDIGLAKSQKGSVIYAAAKGIVDAGIEMPLGDVAPAPERIRGLHIAEYAQKLKQNKEKYEKQFSALLKRGLDPEEIEKHFEEIKSKI